ncbi:MAG: LysR family transcriptional regulator [Sandaracinaceae bacterium]|nr:LysR family transcriptional regulator [Sandaracinaceae bacterium]
MDEPRWDDLRVFLAVFRAESFSAGAKALGVEQSTVSRRVAALEELLGGALFDRTARGPTPTTLGRVLAERAADVERAAFACWDAVRAQGSHVTGRVRLATTESFAVHILIPRLLVPLRERHPGLEIDLVLGEQAADLGRREADLAVRFFRTADGDLVEKRIARLPTAILGPRGMAKKTLALHELRFIALELAGGVSPDAAYLRKLGIEPALRISSHLAQIESVRAGLGVAVLTRALCALFPDLAPLPVEAPASPPVDLYLVAPRTLRKVPAVDAVWRALEALARELEHDLAV